MINTLQMITHMLLMRAVYPSNYMFFISIVYTILSFEFLPTEDLIYYLNFTQTGAFSD